MAIPFDTTDFTDVTVRLADDLPAGPHRVTVKSREALGAIPEGPLNESFFQIGIVHSGYLSKAETLIIPNLRLGKEYLFTLREHGEEWPGVKVGPILSQQVIAIFEDIEIVLSQ